MMHRFFCCCFSNLRTCLSKQQINISLCNFVLFTFVLYDHLTIETLKMRLFERLNGFYSQWSVFLIKAIILLLSLDVNRKFRINAVFFKWNDRTVPLRLPHTHLCPVCLSPQFWWTVEVTVGNLWTPSFFLFLLKQCSFLGCLYFAARCTLFMPRFPVWIPAPEGAGSGYYERPNRGSGGSYRTGVGRSECQSDGNKAGNPFQLSSK